MKLWVAAASLLFLTSASDGQKVVEAHLVSQTETCKLTDNWKLSECKLLPGKTWDDVSQEWFDRYMEATQDNDSDNAKETLDANGHRLGY